MTTTILNLRQKKDLILAWIKSHSDDPRIGEISPNINPFISPDQNVKYFDFCSTEELARRASGAGRQLPENFGIDYVISRDISLSQAAKGNTFSHVISSHVIEHIPDLIGHLLDVEKILTENGSYIAVVPDKRFMFDIHKPDTTIGELVQAHLEDSASPSISSVIDAFFYEVKNNAASSLKGNWKYGERTSFVKKYPGRIGRIKQFMSDISAIDSFYGHLWNFTPESFAEFIYAARNLEVLPGFGIKAIRPTGEMDFIVELTKNSESWNSENEVIAQATLFNPRP